MSENNDKRLRKFADHLIAIREKKELSQRHLATLSGVDQSNLSKIEKFGANLTLTTLFDLAEALNISPKDIQAMLLGGHGDTMVPLPRYTTVAGIPVTELIDKDKLNAILERTKVGGGELVKLMGTSAWYAPGSAAAQMVEAIVKDQRRVFPVCIKLEGEYGINDCYLGVPVVLGKNGIERVIELDLNDEEKSLLESGRKAVKEVMGVLEKLG